MRTYGQSLPGTETTEFGGLNDRERGAAVAVRLIWRDSQLSDTSDALVASRLRTEKRRDNGRYTHRPSLYKPTPRNVVVGGTLSRAASSSVPYQSLGTSKRRGVLYRPAQPYAHRAKYIAADPGFRVPGPDIAWRPDRSPCRILRYYFLELYESVYAPTSV